MKNKIDVLKEQREAAATEIRCHLDSAARRALADKTNDPKLTELETKYRGIQADFDAESGQLAREQRKATPSSQDQRDLNRFSFTRALNTLLSGKALDGIEAEMHAEGSKEQRDAGIASGGGNFVVPAVIVQRGGIEQRDLTATGGSAGSEGGVHIQTSVGSLIERLRAKLLVGQMGATQLGGLSGNIDFPIFGASDSAAERTEISASGESSPTFSKRTISPKRLPVFVEVSRQLLAQSSLSVEAMIRDDIAYQIAARIDSMAINGLGTANQPTGILNTNGIGAVVGGTNGILPTWDHIVDLETAVAIGNADIGRLGYLTTPGIRGRLKKAKTDVGSGIFVWPTGANELNGYSTGVTTQVPSTLTKGTSAGNCHAIVFGNFADLIVAQWGGVEFLANPYSRDTEGIVRINAWTFYDVLVRRAESFAAMKDALVS